MATPRKRWFRVADSILREDWSDATLATHMRLMAWLNQRWARDGIDHSEAGSAVIGATAAMEITRTHAPRAALRKLARHPREAGLGRARATLDDNAKPTRVILEWDKFPEFQEYAPRSPGSHRPVTSPSDSDSEPTPNQQEQEAPGGADARAAEKPEPRNGARNYLAEARAVWPACQEAAGKYGRRWDARSSSRINAMAARLRDHPDQPAEILVHAIHGAWISFGEGKRDGPTWNASAHLVPKTIYRPSNFDEYLECYRAPPPGSSAPKRELTKAERLEAVRKWEESELERNALL